MRCSALLERQRREKRGKRERREDSEEGKQKLLPSSALPFTFRSAAAAHLTLSNPNSPKPYLSSFPSLSLARALSLYLSIYLSVLLGPSSPSAFGSSVVVSLSLSPSFAVFFTSPLSTKSPISAISSPSPSLSLLSSPVHSSPLFLPRSSLLRLSLSLCC